VNAGPAAANAEGSFKTHAAYMAALASAADRDAALAPTAGLQGLTARAKQTLVPGLDHPQRGGADVAQVRRSLTNAWGTELLVEQALMLFEDDETIRVANHWAVVMAYYVVYHLSQAFAVALGGSRPRSHPATLKAYAASWLDRTLNLHPWSLGLGPKGWRNEAPSGPPDDRVHPWAVASPYDHVGLLIRTTREHDLNEKQKKARASKRDEDRTSWRREEARRQEAGKKPRHRPRFPLPLLSAADKATVDRDLGSYGIMHYLCRLRVKSNYLDPDTFIEGPPDSSSSGRYLADLRYFLAATSLVYELRVGHLITKQLKTWATDWGNEHSPARSRWALGPADRARLIY
jgi:hypothetical protein